MRVLELLAECGEAGCPEGILSAHGFAISDMVELVRAGLATAHAERVVAGSRKLKVARVRITDAGDGYWKGAVMKPTRDAVMAAFAKSWRVHD